MPEYEPVIGLEVHAELLTQSKMFCGCAVVDSTRAQPNTAVCEICTGMPGTLPAVNARAVEFALRVALALKCNVAETSVFARKNYFYPDLPKGYQISQYELPLARGGWLTIQTGGGQKRVRIRRVHLEEDTGKLFHRDRHSLVDYNRSGVPLLEIVSEPDMGSIDEVKAFATCLRSLLRYLEVTTGDMEKGVMRFEANVSVRPPGSEALGTRTEIKNLNSFRAMVHAVAYEIERQTELLNQGQPVTQETLGWDEAHDQTVSQRGKEEAHDYRYFTEPDLPPLQIEPSWIERVRGAVPELPDAKRAHFTAEYGLTPYAAGVLTAERAVADFFEAAVAATPSVAARKIAHWLTGDLFALLNQAGLEIRAGKVTPEGLGDLVALVEAGKINPTTGKAVLAEMFQSGTPPAEIVQSHGLGQVSDPEEIERLVIKALEAHPDQVAQYLAGKKTVAEWLFGQVMRAAGGKANPSVVRSYLESRLKELDNRRQAL
jgi:aspartyl-tRNA(Asn)/glutamyl-tRNA(Gln) amidotransferase subunit B